MPVEAAASSGVALVTGAGRGIGRAVARQLALDGYDVAFCYRQSEAAAQELTDELRALGRRVFHRSCDVAQAAEVRRFVAEAESALGPFSVLVNNAGMTRDSSLLSMTLSDWEHTLAVNLSGVFNFCQATVFGFMKRKEGAIINISSVSGLDGRPGQVNYAASKAGIIGLTKSLAKEIGRYNVRVNVVAPGLITTDMTTDLSTSVVDAIIANTSLRRPGTVEEVAGVVSFLASRRASFMTGQVIRVDGGF